MKNGLDKVTTLLLILFLWIGVSPASAKVSPTYQNVTVEQALTIIQENRKNSMFVIIDVRTPAEFQQGHIEGAVLIDILSPSFNNKINSLDKTKQYFVYCRSGNRSRRAMDFMEKLKFEKVYNMKGGFKDWASKGFNYIY